MSWPKSFLAALLLVISAFAFAMGVNGLLDVQPSFTGYLLSGLVVVVATVWLTIRIHERNRRKEDR